MAPAVPFRDRAEAGRKLGQRLAGLDLDRPVVVGLPRGGVPVAAEVARALGAPLDVIVVRKLGCPGQPELGLGAVGEDGVRLVNERLRSDLRVTAEQFDAVVQRETAELERRVARYRNGRAPLGVEDRTVVLVDDGLATGFTAGAAIEVLRRQGAGRVVLAVPVAPADTVAELRGVADDVVALVTPSAFLAIGFWYDDFTQVSDSEVRRLLAGR
jgi:putative phosphoribosyl transferase